MGAYTKLNILQRAADVYLQTKKRDKEYTKYPAFSRNRVDIKEVYIIII